MSGKAPGLIPAGLRRAGDPGGGGGGGGGSVASTDITDATAAGRALLTAASVAAQRADLGLGTLATQNASAVAITGGTITGIGSPSSDSDAATKAYVDAMAAGLSWKAPVRVATVFSGAIGSSFVPGANIDGINLLAGDRILIQSQGTASENGIYVVQASGAPVRAADADSGPELVNAAVFVQQGASLHDRAFVCTADPPIVPGTTALTWVGFASALGAATTAYVDAGDNAVVAQLSNYLSKADNLASLTSAATARTNLGLLAIASSAIAANITDATTVGRSMLTAADQAAQTLLIAPATTVLAGLLDAADKVKINNLVAMASSAIAANITDATAVGRSMLTAANQAAQTALIALATTSLDGLLAAADKVKINNLVAMASSAIAANITDATAVGRSMLTAANQAAQTALIALATTSLAGLMSAADKLKTDRLLVLIDSQTVTGVSTYTSPSWAAGAYQKVVIEFSGKLTNSYMRFRFNNLAGSYIDHQNQNTSAVSADNAFYGTNTYARVGGQNLPGGTFGSTVLKLEIWPLTNGFQRQGLGAAHATTSAYSINSTNQHLLAFALDDLVTDITFFTLYTGSAETFTGQMRAWGVPA